MTIHKKIIIFSYFCVSLTQGQNLLHEVLLTTKDVALGMTEDDLAATNDSLFPGPLVAATDQETSFRILMELQGMGSPGHKSIFYLFENKELQGVIVTVSLVGLDETRAKSIAGKNYKRVTAALSSEADQVGILRKDGDLFSSVTLDQWTFNRDPSLKAFHVATNKESSVGVIFGDSSFPISQIFLSSADKRFERMIRDNPSIVDVPRDELEKADVSQHPERRKIEGSPALLNEENKKPGSVEEDRDFPTRPAKSSGGTIAYLFAAVLVIIIVGSAFYVSWKSKRS